MSSPRLIKLYLLRALGDYGQVTNAIVHMSRDETVNIGLAFQETFELINKGGLPHPRFFIQAQNLQDV
ncbi:unnamed protein product [Fusarium graminearum]|nr:unnamed protein product [Fusarium graminearum]